MLGVVPGIGGNFGAITGAAVPRVGVGGSATGDFAMGGGADGGGVAIGGRDTGAGAEAAMDAGDLIPGLNGACEGVWTVACEGGADGRGVGCVTGIRATGGGAET